MARTGRKRVGQVEELAGPSEIKRLLEYILASPSLRVPANRCQGCAIQRLNSQGTSDPVNPEFPVDVTRDPLGVSLEASFDLRKERSAFAAKRDFDRCASCGQIHDRQRARPGFD